MLHYDPQHVSSINMPIFRRTNCIITVSGIVSLCKWLYSMPDESRLQSSLLSSGILYYVQTMLKISSTWIKACMDTWDHVLSHNFKGPWAILNCFGIHKNALAQCLFIFSVTEYPRNFKFHHRPKCKRLSSTICWAVPRNLTCFAVIYW